MLKPVIVLACCLFLVISCGSYHYYGVIKGTDAPTGLSKYQQISVGWLDLGEEKYKIYGFTEKDKENWFITVRDMNTNFMLKYMNHFLGDKTLYTVKNKDEIPSKKGLLVTFTGVNYKKSQRTSAQAVIGDMSGVPDDTLDLTIHFSDSTTGKELYTSEIWLSSLAGSGFDSLSLEARVKNTIYNLVLYIYEKTK